MAIKVRTFPGSASCDECGYQIRFEPVERTDNHCIGECFNSDCVNYEKQFKFLSLLIECEEISG